MRPPKNHRLAAAALLLAFLAGCAGKGDADGATDAPDAAAPADVGDDPAALSAARIAAFKAGAPTESVDGDLQVDGLLNVGNSLTLDGLSDNLVADTAGGDKLGIIGHPTAADIRVGVGTAAPVYPLDVNGALRLRPSLLPSAANGAIYYDNALGFRCHAFNAWGACGSSASAGPWIDAGTVVHLATGTDLVGIGTAAPTAKLQVDGVVRVVNPGTSPAGSEIHLSSPSGKIGVVLIEGNGATSPWLARWDLLSEAASFVLRDSTNLGGGLVRLAVAPNGDVAIPGNVAIAGGQSAGAVTPQSGLHVVDGAYGQFEDNNAGPPPAADCDTDAKRGRFTLDTSRNWLYVCNGAVRGWDYVILNN